MATQPATKPRWADVGGVITTPASGKQDVGWISGENPPSSYFNWLHYWAYQWIVWIASYFVASGEFTISSSAEAVTTPVATFNDWKVKSRQHIDHLGYLGGQVSNWYEQWKTSGTTEPATWTFSGTQTRAYNDPDANMPYRNVTLSLAASAAVLADLVHLPVVYADLDKAIVAEMDVRTGATNWGTANAIQLKWMLQLSNGAAWNRYITFQMNPNNSLFVQTFVVGASTLDTFTSAVALTTNTTYRLRMEMVGSNLNSSGVANTFTVRFYINGSLVRSFNVAAADFPAGAVRNEIALSNVAATAASVQCGPLRMAWNHRLNQDLV